MATKKYVIYNISLEDFFAAEKATEGTKDTEPFTQTYYDSKKIPTKIENYNPAKSERCWHDHHKFPGNGEKKYLLPIKKSGSPPSGSYQGIGSFCSWECMLAYVSPDTRPLMRDSIGYITELLAHENPELDVSTIKPAPPFEVLKAYGGVVSIEEFRAGLHRPKKTNHFIALSQSMEIKD